MRDMPRGGPARKDVELELVEEAEVVHDVRQRPRLPHLVPEQNRLGLYRLTVLVPRSE